MKKFYSALLFAALLCTGVRAQCYFPQELDARLTETNVAVIGAVTDFRSFYGNDGRIYTDHTISADYVVLADGTQIPTENFTITMTEIGGQINEEMLIVYPSLRGVRDAQGLFLLKLYTGTDIKDPGVITMIPVAVHESFLNYDPATGNFHDGDTPVGPLREVLRRTQAVLGGPIVSVTDRPYVPQRTEVNRGRMAPTITGLNPLSPNAGVGDVLTITGSGFGSTPGGVELDSPDDGPGRGFIVVSGDDILEWSDTRIRVNVVSDAGSGEVRIIDADGVRTRSDQRINISYAITNLEPASGDKKTPRLVDPNGNDVAGGYLFQLSNSTANAGESFIDNAPATDALLRAFATWQNSVGFDINVLPTPTTAQKPGRDGINLVSFDNGAYDFDVRRGRGTVGSAFSYYSSCTSDGEFELVEMDILFRRDGDPNGFGGSVNYVYSGSGSGTDFESVALHEIGHTHQLKHVNDDDDVMSYRIINGTTQRSLSAETRAGARYVRDLSLAYNPPVSRFSSGLCATVREYELFSGDLVVFPVELTAFTATGRQKDALLEWRTASEDENSGFAIERSADGRNFVTLGWRDGRGRSTETVDYRYVDATPHRGVNYYRLAQHDYDGTVTHSEVRTVRFAGATALNVWPNPASNTLRVDLPPSTEASEVTLYTSGGQRLRSLPVSAGQSRREFDVSDLPTGVYLLRHGTGTALRFTVR